MGEKGSKERCELWHSNGFVWFGLKSCEPVGLFILYKLSKIIDKEDNRLYREDNLIFIENSTSRKIVKIRKNSFNFLHPLGFNIVVDICLKTAEYLDAKLNFNDGIGEQYKKGKCKLRQVNIKSNHLRHIIEKIPISNEHRLSHNSSSEHIFENIKHDYHYR